MSPPQPVNVPRTIHQVLAQIRSKVFLTTYNPTHARIGTKYLRKKQIGHLALKYYPTPLQRPAVLNRDDRLGMYPGWTGRIPGLQEAPEAPRAEGEGNADAGPSTATVASDSSTTPAESTTMTEEITATPEEKAVKNAELQESRMLTALREAGIKPGSMFFGADNYIEPVPEEHRQLTHWQIDPKEVYRINKLEKRRRIGKVTPRKGEGKRSQLGKRR